MNSTTNILSFNQWNQILTFTILFSIIYFIYLIIMNKSYNIYHIIIVIIFVFIICLAKSLSLQYYIINQ